MNARGWTCGTSVPSSRRPTSKPRSSAASSVSSGSRFALARRAPARGRECGITSSRRVASATRATRRSAICGGCCRSGAARPPARKNWRATAACRRRQPRYRPTCRRMLTSCCIRSRWATVASGRWRTGSNWRTGWRTQRCRSCSPVPRPKANAWRAPGLGRRGPRPSATPADGSTCRNCALCCRQPVGWPPPAPDPCIWQLPWAHRRWGSIRRARALPSAAGRPSALRR